MKKKFQRIEFKRNDIYEIESSLPISFKDLQSVIDKVHSKYPHCQKHEITFTIKEALEIVRKELIKGNTVNLQGFLQKTRLHSYCKLYKGKPVINLKIQTNTPRKIND